MRIRGRGKNGLGKALPIALCMASALVGAWLCLLYAVLSRGPEVRREEPSCPVALQTAEVPVSNEVPVAPGPDLSLTGAEGVQRPRQKSPAHEKHEMREAHREKPRSRGGAAPATTGKGLDLSAYRVKARRSEGEPLLPEDTSLSAKDLQRQQQKRNGQVTFDGGRGLIGDIYRGGKRLLDSMDAATLNASRRVFGSVARPEKAELRPGGGGVRLKIEIPPESVKLGR